MIDYKTIKTISSIITSVAVLFVVLSMNNTGSSMFGGMFADFMAIGLGTLGVFLGIWAWKKEKELKKK